MTTLSDKELQEEDFFPDEADARASTERLYYSALTFLSDHQARHDPHTRFRIGNSEIQEKVKDLLLECHYLYPAYQRSKFHYEDQLFTKMVVAAGRDAGQILELLDALPNEAVKRFLAGRTKRYTVFAPSTRKSIEAFISYCNRRSKEERWLGKSAQLG